jgi:hypothetical protein
VSSDARGKTRGNEEGCRFPAVGPIECIENGGTKTSDKRRKGDKESGSKGSGHANHTGRQTVASTSSRRPTAVETDSRRSTGDPTGDSARGTAYLMVEDATGGAA